VEEFHYEEMKTETPENLVEVQVSLVLWDISFMSVLRLLHFYFVFVMTLRKYLFPNLVTLLAPVDRR
jgi:hypothetical protein